MRKASVVSYFAGIQQFVQLAALNPIHPLNFQKVSILAALITLGGFVNAQGYVSLPFTKETLDSNLSKREVVGNLENQISKYTISVTLGNDQKQKCVLDTGSSELWVFSNQTPAQFTYNPSGGDLINNNFDVSYPDGTKAQGSYYEDKLTLNGLTLYSPFGVSNIYEDNTRWGSFGIGLRSLKSKCSKNSYDNYPYLLKNSGQTETAAYSLNLNTRGAASGGNVLFGAVDTSRYTGKLQLTNGQDDNSFAVEFRVDGSRLVGFLDSGSTYTYLPDHVVASIAASVGATWDDQSNSYIASQRPDNANLTFSFSGTEVTVPSSELLQPVNQSASSYQLTLKPTSQSNGRIILGESFLRSAYTVFDLDHNLVAIAQAVSSNSAPNYQPITHLGIPGASY